MNPLLTWFVSSRVCYISDSNYGINVYHIPPNHVRPRERSDIILELKILFDRYPSNFAVIFKMQNQSVKQHDTSCSCFVTTHGCLNIRLIRADSELTIKVIKVIEFCSDGKPVYDFLLLICDMYFIWHCFSDSDVNSRTCTFTSGFSFEFRRQNYRAKSEALGYFSMNSA